MAKSGWLVLVAMAFNLTLRRWRLGRRAAHPKPSPPRCAQLTTVAARVTRSARQRTSGYTRWPWACLARAVHRGYRPATAELISSTSAAGHELATATNNRTSRP
jgi:hypothetical protein